MRILHFVSAITHKQQTWREALHRLGRPAHDSKTARRNDDRCLLAPWLGSYDQRKINIFGYFLGSTDVIITVVLFRKVPGRGIDKVSAARLSAQLLPRSTELVRSNGH
jgi:hypothetical protein